MPKTWYDFKSIKSDEDVADEDKDFYSDIVAEKKPYFMKYIYPNLMKDYNSYLRNTGIKCIREFRISLDDLMAMPEAERTQKQKEFLFYFYRKMPVGIHDCVMNRICKKIEKEFDGCLKREADSAGFDASLIKSDAEYTERQQDAIRKIYLRYVSDRTSFLKERKSRRDSNEVLFWEANEKKVMMQSCISVCSDERKLCNLIVDMCYQTSGMRQFAWDLCGQTIYKNLLDKNDRTISFPVSDEHGDIFYQGERFSMQRKQVMYD